MDSVEKGSVSERKQDTLSSQIHEDVNTVDDCGKSMKQIVLVRTVIVR